MQLYKLRLFGAVQLLDPAGLDVTPRLAKTRALLAFLAMAQGHPVNRARLQDLLWSTRGQRQGRDSLRKALSELRSCFAALQSCPLHSDGGPVRLSMDQIRCDITAPHQGPYQPQFLEGIDICDPEFESWLAQTRNHLGKAPAQPTSNCAASPAPDVPLFELGLLPIDVDEADPQARILADMVINRLVELMDHSSLVRPYDFRIGRSQPGAGQTGPDVFLTLSVRRLGGDVVISPVVRHVVSSRTILATTFGVPVEQLSQDWLHVTCIDLFDQLCERLVRFDGFRAEEHLASRNVFCAVDHIFRLSNGDLDQAGALLDQASQMVEASAIYAWNAFLSAFKVEKQGRNDPALLDRTEALARHALELDPHNTLSVALVAHVYGFVLRDRSRAAELLRPVAHRSGQSPMLADSLAMHHYYAGEYGQAREYAAQAVQVGRLNPFRYSFTTSLAMCHLMTGDYGPALENCQSAIAQHPLREGHLFEPTLRTMAAAAGHAGEYDIGRKAYGALRDQGGYEPLITLRNADTPFPNQRALTVVQQGMERLNV
ncbi:hypothetical protein BFP70_03535 [Thioclava sp. SK-1]|uniref:hypothetical protein n=1 Tax=Thioclava sp. SK-1 TaxID=1889770 RepID=UPI000824504C|nr:hypothetical protein [Thioclava sp. SK-1]OCX66910.1 hypothetical protein BFP70_03535 [Thioclava sp. SK-1]